MDKSGDNSGNNSFEDHNSGSAKQISIQIFTRALNRLGDLLAEKTKRLELVCCGGIISLMYFGSRTMTQDIDAIFPANPDERQLLIELIRQVSDEQGLAPGDQAIPDASLWLNDSVSFFDLETKSDVIIFEHPFLVLKAATWQELLAHKLHASRHDKDWDDAKLLLQEIIKQNTSKNIANDKQQIYVDMKKYTPFVPHVPDDLLQKRFNQLWQQVCETQ